MVPGFSPRFDSAASAQICIVRTVAVGLIPAAQPTLDAQAWRGRALGAVRRCRLRWSDDPVGLVEELTGKPVGIVSRGRTCDDKAFGVAWEEAFHQRGAITR